MESDFLMLKDVILQKTTEKADRTTTAQRPTTAEAVS
jgi:hypothetical protein